MDLKSVARPASHRVFPSLLDRAKTLPGALAALAEHYPDFECLFILDRERRERRYTTAELWAETGCTARRLIAHGLKAGQTVGIVLPTGPELISAYFGALLAGGIPALASMPLNRVADAAVYRAHLGQLLDNADARIFYCADQVAEFFRADPSALPRGLEIVTSAADFPATTLSSVPALSAFPSLSDLDVATIQYSSGSTGTPNGVLLTHRAILNNVRAIREAFELSSDDVSVNWIPLYHDMGLIDGFLLPVLTGCPTVLIPTGDFMREPALWLWALHHYRGTMSWAPNFAYSLCAKRLSESDTEGLDLSSWRLAVSASEPILADTLEEFSARFGRHGLRPEAPTSVYGLAENVTAVTAGSPNRRSPVETLDRETLGSQRVAKPTQVPGISVVSVGRCVPRCRVEIRDEAGRALPERHVGTIWIQSDCSFNGYRGQPELSKRVLVDGWLDSGDQGYLVGEEVFFVSREKDLIVIGGEKHSPHDIEQLLSEVSGVRQGCAVALGVPNEARGTEDLAVVAETHLTNRESRIDLETAIRRRIMTTLGLQIRYVVLVGPGDVEKTTSGKLARRATRQRYLDHFGV